MTEQQEKQYRCIYFVEVPEYRLVGHIYYRPPDIPLPSGYYVIDRNGHIVFFYITYLINGNGEGWAP